VISDARSNVLPIFIGTLMVTKTRTNSKCPGQLGGPRFRKIAQYALNLATLKPADRQAYEAMQTNELLNVPTATAVQPAAGPNIK